MKSQLTKTAFLTSAMSYFVFLLADYIRPGFVSFHFSVHLLLIPVLIFGFMHARRSTDKKLNPFLALLVLLISCIIVLKGLEQYNGWQGFIVLIIFVLLGAVWIGLNANSEHSTKE